MYDYTAEITPSVIKATKIDNIFELLQKHAKKYFNVDKVKFKILKFEERPVSHLFKVKVSMEHPKYTEKNIFVKICKCPKNISYEELEKRIKREYDIASMLYQRLGNKHEVYTQVRYIACFPEYYTLVTEEALGSTLNSILIRYAKWYPSYDRLRYLEKICYNCGILLKDIHSISYEDRLFELTELVEYIDIRLKKLVVDTRTTFDEELRQRILKYLNAQIPKVSQKDLKVAGAHGDFGPNNILVENDIVKIMDFADFKSGSIYQDITYFYQRLENYMHKPIFRPYVIHRLQAAFCKGYDEDIDITSPIFVMFRIRHVINNFRSILLKKIVPEGKKLPFYKELFDKYILYKYTKWLCNTCKV
jgi:hypothetical protein